MGYTSRYIQRQIKDRTTRRSRAILKVSYREGEYSRTTHPRQLSSHDSHERDEVNTPIAGCDEIMVLDDPTL